MKYSTYTLLSNILSGFLLVLLATCQTLSAQDTVRLVIPEVYVVPGDTILEMPIFIYYDGDIVGLQTEIGWVADGLRLDSVVNGPVIPEDTQVLLSMPNSTNNLRIAISPGGGLESFNLAGDSLLLTLHFTADKPITDFVGVSFVDENISTSAFDVFGSEISTEETNGSFSVQNRTVNTVFSLPRANLIDAQVCIDLLSNGIPKLQGFEFTLGWDVNKFVFNSYQLYDNPLLLSSNEITTTDSKLTISALEPDRPLTDSLERGFPLMELCFLATDINSESPIGLTTNSSPSFFIPAPDGTPIPTEGQIEEGDLYVELPDITDTVELIVSGNTSSPADSFNCIEIRSSLFPSIRQFDFRATWPSNLELVSVALSENPLFNENLFVAAQSEAQIRIGFNGSENIELAEGAVLAELCFSGELDFCTPSVIDIEQQPFGTFFRRNLPHFQVDRPLSFVGTSGNLLPVGADTLRLSLQEVVRDTSQSEHTIKLESLNETCFTAFNFAVEAEEGELELVEFLTADEITSHYQIFNNPSSNPDVVFLSLSQLDHLNPGILPRGLVGTLVYERIGQKDTVNLDLHASGAPFSAVVVEGSGLRLIPVKLYDGKIIFSNTTATDEEGMGSKIGQLEIFPNPATNFITVRGINESLPLNIELFNVLGQKIYTTTAEGNTIQLPTLPAGPYWLHARQENKVWVNKLVIE
jgi:hypothetical protein